MRGDKIGSRHTITVEENAQRAGAGANAAVADLAAAKAAGVPARVVGRVGGVALTLPGAGAISVNALKTANEAWLPGYMEQN